ncbi:MAG TPA: hypothetical protein VGJ45_19670 [Pseudonocardiaceae bacterium]|jgi:hypothetical protein
MKQLSGSGYQTVVTSKQNNDKKWVLIKSLPPMKHTGERTRRSYVNHHHALVSFHALFMLRRN